MAQLGVQALIDITGGNFSQLNDVQYMRDVFLRAAAAGGATALEFQHHQFDPQGVTSCLLLAESHITGHTWPENGEASFDVYTCNMTNKSIDPQSIVSYILACYSHSNANVEWKDRGINHARIAQQD